MHGGRTGAKTRVFDSFFYMHFCVLSLASLYERHEEAMLVVGDVEGVLRFRIICERAHTVRSSWRKNKKKTRCRKCLVFNGHEKSSAGKIFPLTVKSKETWIPG